MRNTRTRHGSPSQPKAYPAIDMECEILVPEMVAPANQKLIRTLIWNAKYWNTRNGSPSQLNAYPAIDMECVILVPEVVALTSRELIRPLIWNENYWYQKWYPQPIESLPGH